FGAHLESKPRCGGIDGIHLQAEQAVERDHLLEDLVQQRLEASLFVRGSRGSLFVLPAVLFVQAAKSRSRGRGSGLCCSRSLVVVAFEGSARIALARLTVRASEAATRIAPGTRIAERGGRRRPR